MRPQLILSRYLGSIIIDSYLLLFLQGIKLKYSHLSSLISFQRQQKMPSLATKYSRCTDVPSLNTWYNAGLSV